MILAFDLATKRCGWCAGRGDKLPAAGAFILGEREDLGRMGVEVKRHVLALHNRFPADHWVIEAPLLTPHDQLWTLERIYGVAFLVHTLGASLGIATHRVHWSSVKSEFAGVKARKQDMISMCEALGIALPETLEGGKADAADAVGVWKVGLRLFAPQMMTAIDGAVHRRRGGLI